MTIAVNFSQQLLAAFPLYEVKVNTPEFKYYLHDVHHFFESRKKWLQENKEVIISRPKQQPEDTEVKPLRLIPFLTFVYARTNNITVTPMSDDYSGVASAPTLADLALSQAMTSVQESFNRISLKKTSLHDSSAPAFPYYAAVNISQDTIHAVFPVKSMFSSSDQMVNRNFADACFRYTSFSTFTGIDEYILAVEKFYQLLKKEDYISVFQPKTDEQFDLKTYLSLVYAGNHGIRPVFYNAEDAIAELPDSPLAHQAKKVNLAFAALV